MLDVKKIQELIQLRPDFKAENLPKHIIFNPPDTPSSEKKYASIKELLGYQLEFGIPIFTINFGRSAELITEKELSEFFEVYLSALSKEKKIRVLVIGKWTKLKGYIVDHIKRLIIESKDYNDFFLNICIGYDGQVEIMDACRVLIKKVCQNKEEPDSIDLEKLKENLYSSYFLPPDLIVEFQNALTGTFLWDTKGARVIFLNKTLEEFNKQDLIKCLDFYRRSIPNQ
jgi:undecaprenyl diphosphate synthase